MVLIEGQPADRAVGWHPAVERGDVRGADHARHTDKGGVGEKEHRVVSQPATGVIVDIVVRNEGEHLGLRRRGKVQLVDAVQAFFILAGEHQAARVPVELQVADIGARFSAMQRGQRRCAAQAGEQRDFVGQPLAVDIALLLPILRQGQIVGAAAHEQQAVGVQQRVGQQRSADLPHQGVGLRSCGGLLCVKTPHERVAALAERRAPGAVRLAAALRPARRHVLQRQPHRFRLDAGKLAASLRRTKDGLRRLA